MKSQPSYLPFTMLALVAGAGLGLVTEFNVGAPALADTQTADKPPEDALRAANALTVQVGELEGKSGETEPSVTAPELGMALDDLTPQAARALGYDERRGALVTAVKPGGLAAASGLQPNDVIVSVQDAPVTGVAEFRAQLGRYDLKTGVRLG